MKNTSSRRVAFTMLEMLLALAIFAILLGLVITAMPHWQQTARVKQAAELTKTGLEFARNRANAMNSNTRFSIETNAFWVADPFTSAVLLSNTLPKGVLFTTNSTITFTPGSRTTDSTNSMDIVLAATGNPLTSTIRISQASATVRIIR